MAPTIVEVGKAYLVGAGPGQPDLITVRGWRLLQTADVVLYDSLIAPELLQEVRPSAVQIFVGKRAGHHYRTQREITQLIINYVKSGKQVVRLKGGDPFVFGRGGEEALELAAAGLPFEIVPGISSAISVPAFAGIPVTHRGLSTGFAVITGHEDPHKPEQMTHWMRYAHVPTLVILMGVKNLPIITEQLIEAGRAGSTPAAAISQGTTVQQRTILATLETIAAQVQLQALPTPAITVIGEVAALHEQLDWFVPQMAASGFVPMEG